MLTSQTSQANTPNQWKIKLLYDGACPLCVREVNFLQRKDRDRGLIKLVDIAADDYDSTDNADISFETAMGRIHAILPNGEIIQGVEVFRQTYDTLGIGWIYAITKLPVFGWLAETVYEVWADYRLWLTGRNDLQTVIAERQQRLQALQSLQAQGNQSIECLDRCTTDRS